MSLREVARRAGVKAGLLTAVAAAWSLVHGVATLWLNGNFPRAARPRPGRSHPHHRSLPQLPGSSPAQVTL
jgi:hypothetical protein